MRIGREREREPFSFGMRDSSAYNILVYIGPRERAHLRPTVPFSPWPNRWDNQSGDRKRIM